MKNLYDFQRNNGEKRRDLEAFVKFLILFVNVKKVLI